MFEQSTPPAVASHEIRLPFYGVMIFVATLVLLMIFQSSSLVTLSYDLPPSPLNETLVSYAETWHSWMQTTGAAGVTEFIREKLDTYHQSMILE